MNDKQKQIEKIAKVIFEYVDSKDLNKVYILHSGIAEDMKIYCHNYGVAKELYNAGYRKIPEGSVVLMEEEFNDFQVDSAKVKFLKKEIEKQVVKEILDKMRDWGKDFFIEYIHMEEHEFNGILDEIAKQYGVEL